MTISDNDTIPDEEDENQIQNWKKTLGEFERRQTRSVARRSESGINAQQALDDINDMSVSGSDTDSEDVKTLTEENLNSELREEWLDTMNKAFGTKLNYTIENLLLFMVNKASFTFFSGNSNANKYEEFKCQVLKFSEMNTFEEKFKFIKKALISHADALQHRCRLFHSEMGKVHKWKDLVADCKSLSMLYLFTYVQFTFVNWKMLKISACDVCKKRGARFEKVDSLEANFSIQKLEQYWKDEDEYKLGFYVCFRCDIGSKTRATHRRCFEENREINESSNIFQFHPESTAYRCMKCTKVCVGQMQIFLIFNLFSLEI